MQNSKEPAFRGFWCRSATVYFVYSFSLTYSSSLNEYNLCERIASDDESEDEIISKFEKEFSSKKRECPVLIVRATSNSEIRTIAGFSDKGEFRKVVIDDPSDELFQELKKKPVNVSRIVELATSRLDRTRSGKLDSYVVDLKTAEEAIKPKVPGGCDLRLMEATDGDTEHDMIHEFKMEFKSKKNECAVLIVRATSDSEKWTIAGFSDTGKFREVVIDNRSHELSEELNKVPINECRIVELATSSLGRTLQGIYTNLELKTNIPAFGKEKFQIDIPAFRQGISPHIEFEPDCGYIDYPDESAHLYPTEEESGTGIAVQVGKLIRLFRTAGTCTIRITLLPRQECDLRLMVASDDNTEDDIIRKFKMEFKSKKRECTVLIVRATRNLEKWTIAGFNDKGEFREVVIDDPRHELFQELKKEPINEGRIFDLAKLSLGCTTCQCGKFYTEHILRTLALIGRLKNSEDSSQRSWLLMDKYSRKMRVYGIFVETIQELCRNAEGKLKWLLRQAPYVKYPMSEVQSPFVITIAEVDEEIEKVFCDEGESEEEFPARSKILAIRKYERNLAPILYRTLGTEDPEEWLRLEPAYTKAPVPNELPGLFNQNIDARLYGQFTRRSILLVCRDREEQPAIFLLPDILNVCELVRSRWHMLTMMNKELDWTMQTMRSEFFEEMKEEGEGIDREGQLKKLMRLRYWLTTSFEDPGMYLIAGDATSKLYDHMLEAFRIRELRDNVQGKLALMDRLATDLEEYHWLSTSPIRELRARRLGDKSK